MVARGRDEMGEEAGGPEARCRAQGWHIVEGSSQEKDMLSGSKKKALGLPTPSRSHPPALGIWGQKDKEDTGRQIRHNTGRQALTENSIIMSSWDWKKKIKSHFLKTKFWG